MIAFIKDFLSLFNEMAIYLLLGFAVAGILRTFFSNRVITRYLGKNSIKSNILASLFGVPLPLCSCGVVPTGISLYKQGASKGSAISFLTSTPQTGVDSILVTYGFLGLPLTLYKVFIALITGASGGIFYDTFSKDTSAKESVTSGDDWKISSFKEYFDYSFIGLLRSLRTWLMIGILIASLISIFISPKLLDTLGLTSNYILSYFVMLIVAIPLYVCSAASVPIAATLLVKGFPAGAAIVFLLAGPATNAATVTVLWKALGKKATVVYLLNIILGSIFFAFLFDHFFPNYSITIQFLSEHSHSHLDYIKYAGSVILAGLLGYTYFQDIFKKA